MIRWCIWSQSPANTGLLLTIALVIVIKDLVEVIVILQATPIMTPEVQADMGGMDFNIGGLAGKKKKTKVKKMKRGGLASR